MQNHRLGGFFLIWIGQSVSLIGTAMTRFALTIWAYQETGSATVLALVAFFSFAPTVLLSPIAGAIVDRYNRKYIMILADTAAGIATMSLLFLYVTGQLQIWHLFVAGAFASTFESFQFPAFSAAITMMLHKKDYARASGMQSISEAGSTIAAPIIATIVLSLVGIGGVMLIDVLSFFVAIGTLALTHVPQPKQSDLGAKAQGSLLKESAFGFRYIWARPPLLGMQMIFFLSNLFATMVFVLLPALILARTDSSQVALASVETASGIGGLLGGLLISIWGGPKRKVHGVFMGMFLSSILGQLVIGLGSTTLIWACGGFLTGFFIPMINSSNQAIWQVKVPPDLQGRVFSVRRLIAQVTGPAAMLIAGPLADQLFEPAMRPDGALAPIFGGLLGTGVGSGIALMFVLTSILGALSGLAGYAFPFIRNIEDILPDYVGEDDESLTSDITIDGTIPEPA